MSLGCLLQRASATPHPAPFAGPRLQKQPKQIGKGKLYLQNPPLTQTMQSLCHRPDARVQSAGAPPPQRTRSLALPVLRRQSGLH